jgi:methylenetetrahydrofolate reductase (NADPH)
MSKPTISFEFFPPKSEAAEKQLWDALPKLAALNPSYMTVTYGAGGSTRDGTVTTLRRMVKDYNIPVASHLTFINMPKKSLYELTDNLWAENIKHIVALRGDLPPDLSWPLDPDALYFQKTSEFVAALHARHEFEISVAAYPEKHPDAPSLEADIQALKEKCNAGATRAITQFFFDNQVFYDFVEKCQKAGIRTPICPGLLPIHDFKSMQKFAARCQANVPAWLHEKFAGLEDKPYEARKVATELLCKQAEDLARNKVAHIHFYTLNKSDITTDACKVLS